MVIKGYLSTYGNNVSLDFGEGKIWVSVVRAIKRKHYPFAEVFRGVEKFEASNRHYIKGSAIIQPSILTHEREFNNVVIHLQNVLNEVANEAEQIAIRRKSPLINYIKG